MYDFFWRSHEFLITLPQWLIPGIYDLKGDLKGNFDLAYCWFNLYFNIIIINIIILTLTLYFNILYLKKETTTTVHEYIILIKWVIARMTFSWPWPCLLILMYWDKHDCFLTQAGLSIKHILLKMVNQWKKPLNTVHGADKSGVFYWNSRLGNEWGWMGEQSLERIAWK